MTDKVSIVVPIYNRERFLDKCIKSLIAQTYTNIEIILVNDGSKDKSLDICKKYAKDDKRIKIIDKENGGVQSARNRGIDEATGKYLCFVDADDYVSKDFILNFTKVYDEEDVECVVCGHYRVDENDNILVNNDLMINLEIPSFESERWALYFERFACYTWNHMFILDIVKKYNVKFDKDIIIFDDTAFTMNYLNYIDKIGFTNANDYYYVVEHNELTVAKRLKSKRVCDGGSKAKVNVCVNKYNNYITNRIYTCDDYLWVSSSLAHTVLINTMVYMSTVLYDYRYTSSVKKTEFFEAYKFAKKNRIDDWYYDSKKLHTKLSSVCFVKAFKVLLKFYSIKLIYIYCKFVGNENFINFKTKLKKLICKYA